MNNIYKIIDDFKEIKKFADEKKKELNKEILDKFTEALHGVFNQLPKLKCFTWIQYTPFYNDGDECVFEVDYYSLALNSRLPYDYDRDNNDEFYTNYYEGNEIYKKNRDGLSLDEREEAWIAIHTLLIAAGDDTLKDIFG